jgi:hypothetical protein
MAVGEETITVAEAPDAALRRCVGALTSEGFKDIQSQPGNVITASKRPFGQWTRTHVALTLDPDAGGTRITVTARATAQSLTSLASPPAQRMVGRITKALES